MTVCLLHPAEFLPVQEHPEAHLPMPAASEPEVVYERTSVANKNFSIDDKRERLSVDEYFDELWSMYLTKRENLQN